MSKRGPKKKPGARYPSGGLRPANDGPTDEHKARRQELVGTTDPKKQPLASYELGVRFARHDISGPEFSAGLRYARLFNQAVHPLAIASILKNLVAGGGLSLAMAAVDQLSGMETHPLTGAVVPIGTVAREDYLSARRALGRCGSRIAGIVDEIAVYDHPNAAAKGETNHADFCAGLDTLSRHFERADARSRAAQAR
jgi:hypothetical protein